MQLSALYIWLKALHIAFMVTWFAGLFYLPRLYLSTANRLPRGHQALLNRQLLHLLLRDPCRKLPAIVSATILAVAASHPDIDAGQVHAALSHTRGA